LGYLILTEAMSDSELDNSSSRKLIGQRQVQKKVKRECEKLFSNVSGVDEWCGFVSGTIPPAAVDESFRRESSTSHPIPSCSTNPPSDSENPCSAGCAPEFIVVPPSRLDGLFF